MAMMSGMRITTPASKMSRVDKEKLDSPTYRFPDARYSAF
jgi:hypothetical protein